MDGVDRADRCNQGTSIRRLDLLNLLDLLAGRDHWLSPIKKITKKPLVVPEADVHVPTEFGRLG